MSDLNRRSISFHSEQLCLLQGVLPFGFCLDLFHQSSEFALFQSLDEEMLLMCNAEVLEGFGQWQVIIESDHPAVGLD